MERKAAVPAAQSGWTSVDEAVSAVRLVGLDTRQDAAQVIWILVAAHGCSRKSEPPPLFCHKKGPKLQNLQVFSKFLQKTAKSCKIFQTKSHASKALKRLLFGPFATILPNTRHFILDAPSYNRRNQNAHDLVIARRRIFSACRGFANHIAPILVLESSPQASGTWVSTSTFM